MQIEECIKRAIVDVETIDFNDNVNSANKVNKVVTDVTEGKITQIVEPSDLIQARFLLLNAIYFKGTWLNKFDKARTRRVYFLDERGEKNVSVIPLMVMQNTLFKYGKTCITLMYF